MAVEHDLAVDRAGGRARSARARARQRPAVSHGEVGRRPGRRTCSRPRPGVVPMNQVIEPVANRSRWSTAPPRSSSAKNSTATPGSPSALSIDAGTSGVVREMSTPGSWTISTSAPRRSRSASSGERSSGTGRLAEPPPMITARPALGPMTATVRSSDAANGQHVVVAQQHHRRGRGLPGDAPGARAGPPTGARSAGSSSRPPTRSSTPSSRSTAASTQGLVDLARPDRVGQRRAVGAPGAGHLEVEPRGDRLRGVGEGEPVGDHEALEAPLAAQHVGEQPAAVGAVLAVEAVVGGHDPEGAALLHRQLERAARWISRSVRSSITESASMRSSSDSLPAKCLTVQATPSDWAPRTKAAPMRPARSGSSE